MCSLRDGPPENCEDWSCYGLDDQPMQDGVRPAANPKNGPITLTFCGQQTTLRPWDPSTCPLSAAIHNRLVHFPIQPKTNVFAAFWSLQSLSHISDTLGPAGRLIAVLSSESKLKPETVHHFVMRHANTTVIFEDPKEASFERYERLLSLPDDSRYAFLMAFHPRLGADSPARILKPEASKICTLIFDFLVCTTPAETKSLMIWNSNKEFIERPGETSHIFDQALKHIHILQRWRKPKCIAKKKKASEIETSESKERIWIIMDVCNKSTIGGDLDMKLVNEMGKMGLLAKEQLSLTPWFPDRSLLLFQYALRSDEREDIAVTAGVEEAKALKAPLRPPNAVFMPVPSFRTKGASEAPARSPPNLESEPAVPSVPPNLAGISKDEAGANYMQSRDSGQKSMAYAQPPGLGPPQASPSMMTSEESKWLSYLQARHAQQTSGAQASQWQAGMSYPEGLTPGQLWQQGGMMSSVGDFSSFSMGKGGATQGPGLWQGAMNQPQQVPYYGQDMNFMPMNF